MTGLFITATGTSAGKTYVTRALARALSGRSLRVAAVKPIETGCNPHALDAEALATAAEVDPAQGCSAFYRAELPLAPYAVELETGLATPDQPAIVHAIHTLAADVDWMLVEGAGGLLVPLDQTRSMADFARELGYPLLIIAPNALGVLSHALTAFEAAIHRGLPVLGFVLTQLDVEPADPSRATNSTILRERTGLPVLLFPHLPDDDNALAAAAVSCGLLELLGCPG